MSDPNQTELDGRLTDFDIGRLITRLLGNCTPDDARSILASPPTLVTKEESTYSVQHRFQVFIELDMSARRAKVKLHTLSDGFSPLLVAISLLDQLINMTVRSMFRLEMASEVPSDRVKEWERPGAARRPSNDYDSDDDDYTFKPFEDLETETRIPESVTRCGRAEAMWPYIASIAVFNLLPFQVEIKNTQSRWDDVLSAEESTGSKQIARLNFMTKSLSDAWVPNATIWKDIVTYSGTCVKRYENRIRMLKLFKTILTSAERDAVNGNFVDDETEVVEFKIDLNTPEANPLDG